MHHFYYFAIFPVTALAVAGYVTLYCAKNSEGRMRTAGKILAGWSFLLAIAVAAMMIIHPAVGGHGPGHFGSMGNGVGGGSMEQSAPTDQAPPPGSATDATPQAPAPDGAGNGNGWKTN